MDVVTQGTILEQAPRVPTMQVCDLCPRVVDDLVGIACRGYAVALHECGLCTCSGAGF